MRGFKHGTEYAQECVGQSREMPHTGQICKHTSHSSENMKTWWLQTTGRSWADEINIEICFRMMM